MTPSLDHPALSLLSELLDVPSPSGREERLGERVSAKVADLGYVPVTDGAGNVLVRLPGRDSAAPLTVVAAHLDEIAMVVVAIDEGGDGTLFSRRWKRNGNTADDRGVEVLHCGTYRLELQPVTDT